MWIIGRFLLFQKSDHKYFTILFLFLFTCTSFADNPSIQQLYNQERWQDLLDSFSNVTKYTPDLIFYKGMAFAQLSRYQEAEDTFQQGLMLAPGDKRFYQELAGLNFKKRNYGQAKKLLTQAHELDAEDEYTKDFLGTIYFLEENLEAALVYWNELSKPQIRELKIEPLPDVDPVLLDGAFATSPYSVLTISDLYQTQRTLNQLAVFSTYRIRLKPSQDNKYDLVLQPVERPTWSRQPIERTFRTFRNIFLETIHPEFYNLDNHGTHLLSTFRWDQENLRASATVSFPFKSKAATHVLIYADLRKEEWDLSQSVEGALFADEFLEMSWTKAAVELNSQAGSRWEWFNGASLSKVDFSGSPEALKSDSLFSTGWSIEYFAGIEADLIRIPQKRLMVNASTRLSVAKKFGVDPFRFAKLEGVVSTKWFPQSKGDDLLTQLQLRVGKGYGDIPFEELYVLGVEKDSNLWMRGHNGLKEKRKGSNPIGSEYALMNFEIDKILYEHSLFQWKLSPFLDFGGIRDSNEIFGSNEWLIDAGMQSKLRVLSNFSLVLTYGKNLRTGANTFYFTASI